MEKRNDSLFTLENYEKAKKYLLEKGIRKELIEGYSGYEVVLMWQWKLERERKGET